MYNKNKSVKMTPFQTISFCKDKRVHALAALLLLLSLPDNFTLIS